MGDAGQLRRSGGAAGVDVEGDVVAAEICIEIQRLAIEPGERFIKPAAVRSDAQYILDARHQRPDFLHLVVDAEAFTGVNVGDQGFGARAGDDFGDGFGA